MNCLEFHRMIYVAPGSRDPDALRHAQQCRACRTHAVRMSEMEQDLKQAVQLEVPQQLAAEILLYQSTEQRRYKRSHRMRWFGIAAGVLLFAGIAGQLWWIDKPAALDNTVLAHIHGEVNHLQDVDTVPLDRLNHVLHPFDIQLQQSIGNVTYAGNCLIRKYDGVHIVLQTEAGPVTILFMPHEYIGQRIEIRDQRFHGIIVPTRYGSMAIVAERYEVIEKTEQQLRMSGSMIF